MAEITINDGFGKAIYNVILKYRLYSVLEIGAYNGDGSTQVIAHALSHKGDAVSLTSLEYNPDRYKELVKNTLRYPFVHPVNSSSIGNKSFTARDFENDVWEKPYNGLRGRYEKSLVKSWHDYDLHEIDRNPLGYLESSTTNWDAVLIDGGEFMGYDEFRLIKDRTSCIILDDAFHAFKTFRARLELLGDPCWALEWESKKIRNGAAIFVRKTLKKESLLTRLRYLF